MIWRQKHMLQSWLLSVWWPCAISHCTAKALPRFLLQGHAGVLHALGSSPYCPSAWSALGLTQRVPPGLVLQVSASERTTHQTTERSFSYTSLHWTYSCSFSSLLMALWNSVVNYLLKIHSFRLDYQLLSQWISCLHSPQLPMPIGKPPLRKPQRREIN